MISKIGTGYFFRNRNGRKGSLSPFIPIYCPYLLKRVGLLKRGALGKFNSPALAFSQR